MKNVQESAMKNSASQKYRKFLYEISFRSTKRILVWGNDMTSRNEDNFLLVNNHGKIVTFDSKADLICQSDSILQMFPDKENSKLWIENVDKVLIDGSFDFRLLSANISEIFSVQEKAKMFISCVNLISDYAGQVSDENLKKILNSYSVNKYWNYAYNNFFWRKKSTIETSMDRKIMSTGVSRNLEYLVLSFKTCFDFPFD